MLRRRWSRVVLSALVGAMSFAGCVGEPPLPGDPVGLEPGTLVRSSLAFNETSTVPAADVRDLGARQLALASDLLALTDDSANQALSPTSIAMAFSMLSAGAGGNTLAELEDALHLPPQADLHARMNALVLALRDRDVAATEDNDGLALSPVNELFPQQGFDIEAPFLDTLGVNYDAGVRLMDYQTDAEGGRAAINAFVGDATRGKIPALLPPGSIDAATRLVLVNALYLKGAWLNPFDPDATADATFHAPAGDVTVPFLNGIHDSARNSTSRSMDIVELPLVGDALSLAIIPLDSVVGDLDFATLGDELALLDEQPVTPVQMSLPKFTVRVATDLVPALQSLGVSDLFGPADLSGINATADLAVTGAFHETFFALDEKGIEAAAATAIVVGAPSVPPPPVSVVVDGPFFFVLRDRATNTPLFVGTIVDPSGS